MSSLGGTAGVIFVSRFTGRRVLGRVSLSRDGVAIVPGPMSPAFGGDPGSFGRRGPEVLRVNALDEGGLGQSVYTLRKVGYRLHVVKGVSRAAGGLLLRGNVRCSYGDGLARERVISRCYGTSVVGFPSLFRNFNVPVVRNRTVNQIIIASGVPPVVSVTNSKTTVMSPCSMSSVRRVCDGVVASGGCHGGVVAGNLGGTREFGIRAVTGLCLGVCGRVRVRGWW